MPGRENQAYREQTCKKRARNSKGTLKYICTYFSRAIYWFNCSSRVLAQARSVHTAGARVRSNTATIWSLALADASTCRCSPSQHIPAVVIKITHAQLRCVTNSLATWCEEALLLQRVGPRDLWKSCVSSGHFSYTMKAENDGKCVMPFVKLGYIPQLNCNFVF